MIKKEVSKYTIYSKDGSKKLGTYNTKKEVEKREKQVEIFVIGL